MDRMAAAAGNVVSPMLGLFFKSSKPNRPTTRRGKGTGQAHGAGLHVASLERYIYRTCSVAKPLIANSEAFSRKPPAIAAPGSHPSVRGRRRPRRCGNIRSAPWHRRRPGCSSSSRASRFRCSPVPKCTTMSSLYVISRCLPHAMDACGTPVF